MISLNWAKNRKPSLVCPRPVGGTPAAAPFSKKWAFSINILRRHHPDAQNALAHTRSCIKAVITVLNNWSQVKLHCSKVSQHSLSQFRVDGWRGKSKLLMRVCSHDANPMDVKRTPRPLKTCSFVSARVHWTLVASAGWGAFWHHVRRTMPRNNLITAETDGKIASLHFPFLRLMLFVCVPSIGQIIATL